MRRNRPDKLGPEARSAPARRRRCSSGTPLSAPREIWYAHFVARSGPAAGRSAASDLEGTLNGTCIVTGGAGFIGCALSGSLADRFRQVIAVDNLHPQVHPQAERPARLDERVELVTGDVTESHLWDKLLPGKTIDVIVHLAAETGTGQSLTEGTRHAQVNVVGLTTMLDALVRHETLPGRIVLSSSRAVYGEGAWAGTGGSVSYPGQRSKAMLDSGQWDFPGLNALPFEASRTVPYPTSIYGATKLAQEHVLTAWGQALGVETPILRLQNVYGPGQSLSNPYTGIVPLFARLAKRGDSIPVYEDGEIIRDFVFIDDVAAVLAIAAAKGTPGTVPHDIGTGGRTSILQLARMIAELYGAPAPRINGMFRHGDVRSAACDIERTKRELGWAPKVGVEQGVRALCAWIDAERPV